MTVKCLAQEHSTRTWQALESSLPYSKSNALTFKPPRPFQLFVLNSPLIFFRSGLIFFHGAQLRAQADIGTVLQSRIYKCSCRPHRGHWFLKTKFPLDRIRFAPKRKVWAMRTSKHHTYLSQCWLYLEEFCVKTTMRRVKLQEIKKKDFLCEHHL